MARVSSNTSVTKLAGYIAHTLRTAPLVELRAAGSTAVHRVVRATALAGQFLRPEGLTIATVITDEGGEPPLGRVIVFGLYRMRSEVGGDKEASSPGVKQGRGDRTKKHR